MTVILIIDPPLGTLDQGIKGADTTKDQGCLTGVFNIIPD